MYNPHETICAISTPPGESALAVIRLSGKESKSIVEKFFKGTDLLERKATFGELVDGRGDVVDEVVVIWYKAPKSYTAEEMVEIICHGGYVVSQQVLSLLCRSGARLAQPGEFTLRAFLNGRIDLTEAEAVNSIIRAKSSKAKKLAFYNLEGRLKAKLEEINSRLFELITILEAEIDFADEEITKLDGRETGSKIEEIEGLIKEVKSTYDMGRISEGRVQIAIVGAPNVGKSSLFNAMLKADRAIVTATPGTTRDYLSEHVDIGGYPVILTDTAGIRTADESVEIIGIDRTRELIDNVDLCIHVLDETRPLNEDDWKIASVLENRDYVLAINKIDLQNNQIDGNDSIVTSCNPLRLSALTGDGISNLYVELNNKLLNRMPEPNEGVLLSQRQYDCAQKAAEAIDKAREVLLNNESVEILVSILREALEHIGELTGRITSEDILNNIFSRFCIGK